MPKVKPAMTTLLRGGAFAAVLGAFGAAAALAQALGSYISGSKCSKYF